NEHGQNRPRKVPLYPSSPLLRTESKNHNLRTFSTRSVLSKVEYPSPSSRDKINHYVTAFYLFIATVITGLTTIIYELLDILSRYLLTPTPRYQLAPDTLGDTANSYAYYPYRLS
ncbi:hypothetical protein WG66_001435, partial [Moniliophthora roreri]